MPERPEYTTDYTRPLFPLDLNCQVRMRINTARGRVTGFVVQLELEIDDRLYPVVRRWYAMTASTGSPTATRWMQKAMSLPKTGCPTASRRR